MKKYLFEGELQGRFKSLEIHPLGDVANQYLIHWDGFQVGVLERKSHQWHTDDEALVDFVTEIGTFIDQHEEQIRQGK